MDTLTQVEKLISSFKDEELTIFREWFYKFDNQKWDEKLAGDIEAGKLDNIADGALDQFLTGKAKSV